MPVADLQVTRTAEVKLAFAKAGTIISVLCLRMHLAGRKSSHQLLRQKFLITMHFDVTRRTVPLREDARHGAAKNEGSQRGILSGKRAVARS